MDAKHLLVLVARALARARLDTVLIGNAAAAIQGSPATTVDLDFMFRKTPTNLRKLKALADDLDALVLRPFYPASQLYRVTRDRDGLQLDFMGRVDGVPSFEALRANATPVRFGEHELRVASLKDIIRSKARADANRTMRCFRYSDGRSMNKKKAERKRPRSVLARENERAQVEQIRRLLRLPPSKRTHFLRVRLPNGGSAI